MYMVNYVLRVETRDQARINLCGWHQGQVEVKAHSCKYTPVTLVHLLLVYFVTRHCPHSVSLEYWLRALPNLAD